MLAVLDVEDVLLTDLDVQRCPLNVFSVEYVLQIILDAEDVLLIVLDVENIPPNCP
jgi:hypothetical protein